MNKKQAGIDYRKQRNDELYDLFCAGKRYSWLADKFFLSVSGVKQALQVIRKERGVKKEKGKRQ